MVLNSKTITEGVGVRVCEGYKSLLDSSADPLGFKYAFRVWVTME